MTQGFDEWYSNNNDLFVEDAKRSFQAGAQSKQAEIDEHIKRRLELAKYKKDLSQEIDELRKMVKKLIDNTIIGIDDDVENQARDLLKGKTNEQ